MSTSGPDLDPSPGLERGAADVTDESPADTHGQNINAQELLTQAQREVRKFRKDTKSATRSLNAALAHTLALFEYGQKNETNLHELEILYAEREIRLTNRDHFTPLIKLAFPEEQPSNIHRYAAVLKLAHSEGIKSEDLADFIIKTGGIVKCVAAELKQRQAARPKRTSKSDRDFELALERRRRKFRPLGGISGFDFEANEGEFVSIGFKVLAGGQLDPVGQAAEDRKTMRRYLADEFTPKGKLKPESLEEDIPF